MTNAWHLTRKNIQKAQERHKRQHDKKVHEIGLKVGDNVFTFNPAIKPRQTPKFAFKWKGPFSIVALSIGKNIDRKQK